MNVTLEENIEYAKNIISFISSKKKKRLASAFSKYYNKNDREHLIQVINDVHEGDFAI